MASQGTKIDRDRGANSTTDQGRADILSCTQGLTVAEAQRARWGRGVIMRSVAVTNAKGGVGKSTTAVNLAAALVELDQRVLVIDADPSGNATLGFFPTGIPDTGLADLLLEEQALADVIRTTEDPGLDVLPPAVASAGARTRWEVPRDWGRGASSGSAACSGASTATTWWSWIHRRWRWIAAARSTSPIR